MSINNSLLMQFTMFFLKEKYEILWLGLFALSLEKFFDRLIGNVKDWFCY